MAKQVKEVTTRILDCTKKSGAASYEMQYHEQWKAKGVRLRRKYCGPSMLSSWGTSGGNSGSGKHKDKKKGPKQICDRIMVVGPTGKIKMVRADG